MLLDLMVKDGGYVAVAVVLPTLPTPVEVVLVLQVVPQLVLMRVLVMVSMVQRIPLTLLEMPWMVRAVVVVAVVQLELVRVIVAPVVLV